MFRVLKRVFHKTDEFYLGLIVAFLFSIYSILIEQSFINVPLHDIMELKVLDLKFSLKSTEPKGDEIIIIGIDQKSLERFGKWPWEREAFASAVDKLGELGARIIGFDIIFSAEITKTLFQAFDSLEKHIGANSKISGKTEFVKTVRTVKDSYNGERTFAQSIEKFGKVVLGYKFHLKGEIGQDDIVKKEGILEVDGTEISYGGKSMENLMVMDGIHYTQSLSGIRAATNYKGYINTSADWDGVHRRVPLVYKYKKWVYPSFSVLVAEAFLKKSKEPTMLKRAEDGGLKLLLANKLSIPLDDNGDLRINYYGKRGTFKYISFIDLLDGKVSKKDIEDKIVLVGTTAPILHDLKPTPFGPQTPGVEIHATIIDNILHSNFISRKGFGIIIFELLVIFLFGMILGLIMKNFQLWIGIPVMFSLLIGYFLFDAYFLFPRGILIGLVIPFTMLITLYFALAVFKYAVVEARSREIKNKFKHYVADAVVEEMIERKDLNLGMVKKNLTVLFADIRNFATISEQLDPATLEKILNRHMTLLTDAILENGGTVDKYMGDALMAIFGAPLDLDDHAYFASRAAFRMIELLRPFNKNLEEQGYPALKIGVGISTGEVLVGNMGSEYLFNYTVLGREVNIASRIEELNKEYGTNIIISEATLSAIGTRGVVRNLGTVQVKGIERPVNIYALSGVKGITDQSSWSQPSIT